MDSPVKTGRDELMKLSAARSPPSKGPSASDVIIERIVTGTSELVSVMVFLATYPAHQFLSVKRNFYEINGESFETGDNFFFYYYLSTYYCSMH